MSHKSKPGDGSGNNGVKGGGMYGRHFSGDTLEPAPFFKTILKRIWRRTAG
ncbi:MAG: hypothetical protein QOJ29_2247 [Thermoleophilaceae bacterium]|nr:hypothetical protein [Thermoleophilaceae bacterium]